jgi:magnesium-protoporphyrin O-methyltransferase
VDRCCSPELERGFDERVADRDLAAYRRDGLPVDQRRLLAALVTDGLGDQTVLDIGGGIGAIHHDLLRAGARSVIDVDGSTAYLHAAREEARRQGDIARIDYRHGDFVQLADGIEAADIVILLRVLCCYPDMPALVEASAGRAKALWGAVFPRERLAVRLGVHVVNFIQRLRRKAFRVYVHPTAGVEDVLRGLGFTPLHHRNTVLWQVVVWGREEVGG